MSLVNFTALDGVTVFAVEANGASVVGASPVSFGTAATRIVAADGTLYDVEGTPVAVAAALAAGSGYAPTGAAGGDLAGTYPNPTVTQARGLRETGGPTTLAMGAVAALDLLQRVGATVVGLSYSALIAALLAVADIVGWTRTSVLAADVTATSPDAAATYKDVTGLSFPVTAGVKYAYRFVIVYDANLNATGSGWAINGPALTSLAHRSQWALSPTASTQAWGVSAYDTPSGGFVNATSAQATGNIAIMEGEIECSAGGSVIARMAYENSGAGASITAKAGSFVEYRRVT